MVEAQKYEVLEKIGHGSFGVIRKVRRKSDGHVLCRKEISYLRMSQKEKEQLQAELAILKELRHPNIVAYYEREHLKASHDLHIYMEYCEDGDLGKRIKDMKLKNQMAEEDFVWSVFSQLVTALYRCHYGEDPPEVGKNVMGLGNDAKPLRSKQSHAMILHRDLKPENVFLSADACVKLGDFGLSKIMQSHDFASTYVGTPFYMSPEICAAEQYSLHSDIWALGCIIYELCAKEPPFNAKTHLELIQRIRLGRIKPLPSIYSTELQNVISSCLKVNSHSRPDTVQLLNIPMVKLKRKELEIVRLGKLLKTKEEKAVHTLKEAESRTTRLEVEKEAMRREIEDTVRREWELKARLEIDRQVQLTTDKLMKDFEAEVVRRVAEEIKARHTATATAQIVRSSTPELDRQPGLTAASNHVSRSTSSEIDDIGSTTDLSELSLESPTLERAKTSKKNARTPFARAQTMFENSPMDIQMADPSPAPIASLGLSPRRNGGRAYQQTVAQQRNIFAEAADKSSWNSVDKKSSSADSEDEGQDLDYDDDDADDIPTLPSPTRFKNVSNDPFKAISRPHIARQKTVPYSRGNSQPVLFGLAGNTRHSSKEDLIAQLQLGPTPRLQKPVNGSTSPQRRISKLPSATGIISDVGSPLRKAPAVPSSTSRQFNVGSRPASRGRNDDFRQTAMLNSHVQGRTLVELAQARIAVASADDEGLGLNKKSLTDVALGKGPDALLNITDLEKNTVWDPERDEMPSPFLARGGRGILHGTYGGPGMKHLR